MSLIFHKQCHFALNVVPFIATSHNAFRMSRHQETSNKRCLTVPPEYKASYTVEAAVCFPVFIFAFLWVLFFLRILSVEWGVRQSMNETVRTLALMGEGISLEETEENSDLEQFAEEGVLRVYFRKTLGESEAPLSFITGGVSGISLMSSEVTQGEITLVAEYDIGLPVNFFGMGDAHITQEASAARWVGRDPAADDTGEQYVYVTEYGTVYHKSLSCTHLDLSIRCIPRTSLSTERNESGKSYSSCPLCRGSSSGSVCYVTDYGTVYHSSLSCSGLKRTIERVSISECEGMNACTKCGE